MLVFRLLQTCHDKTIVPQNCVNLAVELNLVVRLECVSVVLFPAPCCLTLCYPPQSHKDVVVLVKCAQQLIREERRFERANTVAIGSLKK